MKGTSKSGLFLIELIIAILFFSFCCTITLQLFVKSSLLSRHAGELSNGMMAVQSAAEEDKNTAFEALVPGEQRIYFNQDWEKTGEADSTYLLRSEISFTPREAGTMTDLAYTVYKGKEEIFSLSAKKYYHGVNVKADQNGGDEYGE